MVPEEKVLNGNGAPKHGSRSGLYLVVPAALLQVSYVILALVGNWNSQIPLFLGLYFFCFALYAFCLYWLFKGRVGEVSTVWILAPALLFRLTLLWCEPTLSEDFYRYRWDGQVQAAGHSPYDFPPRAQELAPLRDSYYDRINHKEFRTPYSAAAETFYHLFALVSTKPRIFKSFIVLFDLILLEILRRLLKKENRSAGWLLVYAWHPLPIIEFAGGGHMDVIGISFLLLSYLLLQNRHTALSGAGFAVAVLTKYLPVLTLPWFLKQGWWKFAIACAATAMILLLQYYSPDLNMFSGLLSYYKKWRFNDSLFGFLYKWLGGAEPARVAGILFTLTAIGICLVKKFTFYRAAFVAFASVIIFSPVVHPWYLCWVLPFLVFHPNKPWLFLCGWIVLAYLVRHLYPVGVWKPILWLKLLIYVPFYAFLLFDTLKSMSHFSPRSHRDKTISELAP